MKFLSAKDVAELLNVSVSSVRVNAKKGRISFRCVRVGSKYLFPEEEVYAYIYGPDWEGEIAKRSTDEN